MVDIVSSQKHHRKVYGNYFPSSENGTSGYGFNFPQSTLYDQGLPTPASLNKQVLDLSVSSLPHEISSGSLEIQHAWPGHSRDHPQSPPKLTRGRPTAFYKKVTSLEQPATGNRGRYPCKICGEGFAQPQGVRRHHFEKHEPRSCPHCHTFKWARLYLFKKHVREVHPDVDPKAALLDAAWSGHRKCLAATKHRTHHHASRSESTTGVPVTPMSSGDRQH